MCSTPSTRGSSCPSSTARWRAGADYLDTGDVAVAPPSARAVPHEIVGVKLGDEQFALAGGVGGRPAGSPWWASAWSPGSPTCSPATQPTTSSATIDEVGVQRRLGPGDRGIRVRADVLHLDHDRGVPEPAHLVGAGPGWFTTAPFSEPEVFDFPEGDRTLWSAWNVEHEEVLLVPRWWWTAARVDVQVRAGRGVHRRAADAGAGWASNSKQPGGAGCANVEVSPRDVVAAVPHRTRPSWAAGCTAALPARVPGDRTGARDGNPRVVYLYHLV